MIRSNPLGNFQGVLGAATPAPQTTSMIPKKVEEEKPTPVYQPPPKIIQPAQAYHHQPTFTHHDDEG